MFMADIYSSCAPPYRSMARRPEVRSSFRMNGRCFCRSAAHRVYETSEFYSRESELRKELRMAWNSTLKVSFVYSCVN